MLMDDDTFNFMMYLKLYKPVVHEHFISMLFLGVKQGRVALREIFKFYAEKEKFPWEMNRINLFHIRSDLRQGKWISRSWDKCRAAYPSSASVNLTR